MQSTKKILFVIDSLIIGGAEKSLIFLLNLIDYSKYNVDLLMFQRGGELDKFVPDYVNTLETPEYFRFLKGEDISFSRKIKYLYYRIRTSCNLRINKYISKALHNEQVVFRNIKQILPAIEQPYDVAIAYSQGMPTYFVANKVTAHKKLAWINTDYVTTLYEKDFDYEEYKKFDKIITVSQHIKVSVSTLRQEYGSKVDIVLDILNPTMLNIMADEYKVKEFDSSMVNILTVGRLVTAKSHDKAIEVARLLKQSNYKFKWFVIGDGPQRTKLQQLIDKYKLNGIFILLGKKLNPYPYMKNCDLYVQTSIKEGFGLTVCEAKILKRPIVCTNFPTASEIINDNIDGLIVKHDIDAIYNGILKYLDDLNFRNKIINQLNCIEPYNSLDQLQKFYTLIES